MGRLVPQIMEEITEVIQLLSRSWRLVPQIMEENHGSDSAVEQIVASRATDHGGNHGCDSAVEQIVASRATDHGGNHGSDSAVEQIVASRATDHGGNHGSEQLLRFGADRGIVPQIMERNRDGSEVPLVQFLRLWSSL